LADTNLQEELTALMAASSSHIDDNCVPDMDPEIIRVDTAWLTSCQQALRDLQFQRISLQNQIRLGIITLVDATTEMAMIRSKELKIKKQLVNVVHVKSNGMPRSIRTHGPTSSYPKGYVYTKLEGGKLLKAKDLDSLYSRLYDIYFGQDIAFSMKSVFEKALSEKAQEENPKAETIDKYKRDYKFFISDELSGADIRELTDHDLKAYTQKLVSRIYLKEKAFLAYKTLLNLIFKYAFNHGIISKNPVLLIQNKCYMASCDTNQTYAEEEILSEDEIQMLIDEVNRRMLFKKWGSYYIYGYAMKFSIQTGTRVAEICGLKWSDIDFSNRTIHIHGQQLKKHVDGHDVFYYVPYTKDEKGRSRGGRYFPLTDSLASMLKELRQKQRGLRIHSEYVFCKEDGTWINKIDYGRFFRRLCMQLGFKVTKNHALRKSLNSNILIPNNVSVADRARLLGHSVSTNQNYYSYNQKDYVEKTRDILNRSSISDENPGKGTFFDQEGTYSILEFPKRKTRKC